MTALAKLKLVSVQADRKSPTILRRNKLTGALAHQIALAKAANVGDVYAAKRVKFVINPESGIRTQVETAKRVKPMWFTAPNGKLVLALRYGAKALEISKGKNAIEVTDMDDLVATLDLVKQAVTAGELDTQIEQVSTMLSAGFNKKRK